MGTASRHSVPQCRSRSRNRPRAVGTRRAGIGVDLVIFGLVGAAAAVSWLEVVSRSSRDRRAGGSGGLGGGYPVFREALENLLARRMTMELSMTMALVAALAIREFSTALFILFFVLGAEILEQMTVTGAARRSRTCCRCCPSRRWCGAAATVEELPIAEVRAGDMVVIRPAAEIPVDGVVVWAIRRSTNPASRENRCRWKRCPAPRFSPAPPTTRARWRSRRSDWAATRCFGRIIDAVEKAEHSRAPIQKLADRLAGWLVYFALASAVLTFVVTA